MRGLIAWVSVLGISCGDNDVPGVLIEVNSDIAATRFELQLSVEHCDACTQIAPPSRSASPIFGTGWMSRDLERFSIKLDDARQRARFQLSTDSSDGQYVKRALIVALAGDVVSERETVLAVATIGPFDIPASDSVKFEVELAPAAPLGAATSVEQVELWRQSTDEHTACAVVVHHGGGAEFFVPIDDPDCDDRLTGSYECNEFGYLSPGPPRYDSAACVVASSDATCRIGGPPCVEGNQGPSPTGCTALEPSYCVGQAMCDLTCNLTANASCVDGILPTTPAAFCDIVTQNGGPCPQGEPAIGQLDVHQLVLDTGGKCKEIAIAKAQSPLVFGTSITIGDAAQLATFTIDPSNFESSICSIRLIWIGTLPAVETALVKVVADNGAIRVVPWRITPSALSCPVSNSVSCYATAGSSSDSIYRCQ